MITLSINAQDASAQVESPAYSTPLGIAMESYPYLSVPTLLVIGQEDRTTLGRGFVSEDVLKTLGQYPRLGKQAARDIPGARLVELNRVGHIPHLEAPGEFHKALLDFLNRRN